MERLQELASRPQESLSVELKSWFDPDTPEGISKIARACIALRNANGGFLLVGFDDTTGAPSVEGRLTDDIRGIFHADKLQHIISRYASEPFEVAVHFVSLADSEYPVIEIPPGVRTPVASKADLRDNQGKYLIRINTIFVRSLAANNAVSTTTARWQDFGPLMEICFENREADIGRFVRRHLANLDYTQLREALSTLAILDEKQPDVQNIIHHILEQGQERFKSVTFERGLSVPAHGAWEAALLITGSSDQVFAANVEFLNLLAASNPQLTGWPVWLDSRRFSPDGQPYTFEDGWESLLFDTSCETFHHIDFQRIEPIGRFYLRRAFEDDINASAHAPAPMTVLDVTLRPYRVAEAIVVGIEFAKAMGYPPEATNLTFAFRWTRLRGRELASWANPSRLVWPDHKAYEDDVLSIVNVPLETPTSAVFEYVYLAVEKLFGAFAGFQIDKSSVEQITRELLDRSGWRLR